jgi:hypothetical protein
LLSWRSFAQIRSRALGERLHSLVTQGGDVFFDPVHGGLNGLRDLALRLRTLLQFRPRPELLGDRCPGVVAHCQQFGGFDVNRGRGGGQFRIGAHNVVCQARVIGGRGIPLRLRSLSTDE